MKTKKFSWFYTVLIGFILLVLLLTEIGKSYLRDILADFEAVRPQYAADAVFGRYFSENSADLLYTQIAPAFSPYESPDAVREFLSEHLKEKTDMQCISAGTDGTYSYAVHEDNQRLASFTLVPSGEKSKYGFDRFTLQGLVWNDKLCTACTVEVPVGYSLCLNGILCPETESSGDRIPDVSNEFMPDGAEGILYTTYKFERLCGMPEITAISPDGQNCRIREENGIFRALPTYSDTLAKEYGAYAIEATKAYAAYMQNDLSFGSVKPYFDPDSALYTNIRTAETVWVIDHDGYRFEDAQASEFLSYGDGIFSCRVTLTHILTRHGLRDYKDFMDMTWYFRLVDGQYKIYNSMNNQ